MITISNTKEFLLHYKDKESIYNQSDNMMRSSHEDGDKYFRLALTKLHNNHQKLMLIYIPTVIFIIIMTTLWGYIVGSTGKYDNVETQWQACFTQQIFLSLAEQPLIRVPIGELLTSFGYIGFQTVIFSLIGHGKILKMIFNVCLYSSALLNIPLHLLTYIHYRLMFICRGIEQGDSTSFLATSHNCLHDMDYSGYSYLLHGRSSAACPERNEPHPDSIYEVLQQECVRQHQ
jgi:hypothetical protein